MPMQSPSLFTPSPDEGRFPVMIVKGDLADPARGGRAVPYKLYYPAEAAERYPVVIWSHGLGGSRDGAGFIARYLASHGYVVCNIQHAGTDSSLWEGKPGHPWDNIRKAHIPRSASIERFRDVPFVLDQLPTLAGRHPEAGGVMNTDRIGMSGHSFGSMTTQVMAGQKFPDETGALVRLPEPRFRAGILYSPVPIKHLTDAPADDVYGAITLPLFHMTGTADDSPLENFTHADRLAVYEHSRAERHLLIMEDGDHMVYNGSRGKLENNPKRRKHEDIIKVASLAWWEWFLKEDRNARDWLIKGAFGNWLGTEGTYKASMASPPL